MRQWLLATAAQLLGPRSYDTPGLSHGDAASRQLPPHWASPSPALPLLWPVVAADTLPQWKGLHCHRQALQPRPDPSLPPCQATSSGHPRSPCHGAGSPARGFLQEGSRERRVKRAGRGRRKSETRSGRSPRSSGLRVAPVSVPSRRGGRPSVRLRRLVGGTVFTQGERSLPDEEGAPQGERRGAWAVVLSAGRGAGSARGERRLTREVASLRPRGSPVRTVP